MATFESLNLDKDILSALNDLQFLDATEIQEKAIPEMSKGNDIIGIAQTGTGKTFAYSIPLLTNITEDKYTQALILCPTRELALQVSDEIKKLIKYKKFVKVSTIYGGASYDKQIKELKFKPQIIVGTPGRIIDHMNRKTIDFSNLKTLVLDEADEMLNMGFKDDLETILSTTPSNRQTALFSATMPEFIKHVASNMMNNPVKIEIKKKTLTVDRIKQNLYYLKRESKTDLLIRILDLYAFTKVMVFVNTKSKVEEIVSTLKKKGYKAEALHGDLKQVSRDKVMNGFKEGISHILVCTDVAARGIDVSDLEGIINFDLPQEQELYVHRIGRTGRAGREGLSITFATYSEQRKVFFIERYTRSQMTICQIPSVEEIQAKKIENFVNFLKNNSDVEINESNRPLIEQIKNLNLDTDKLISLLLSLTNFKLSDYPEIHVREEKPRQRSSRDRNERGLDRRNSRESRFEKSRRNDTRGKKDEKALRAEKYSEPKDYVLVKLNIGKENKVKPQELVLMASKLVGVRKSNIGNIKIKENETFVEVTKGALPFMLKLQGKNYNGKTIKVSKGNE
jgi:ATP-dependent RNA helicase DeaD